MINTPEQFASANKQNVESLLTIANAAFASAERIASLNLNTARNILEDSVANAKVLLSAKDAQELVSLQSSVVQPAMDKIVAYSRNLYDIANETKEEFSSIFEQQMSELNKTVNSELDRVSKNAPAGSDVAVAAVKSAIAAANSAYETLSKTAKQVADIAQANMAAATSATVKAVGSAQKAAAAVAPAKSVKKAA